MRPTHTPSEIAAARALIPSGVALLNEAETVWAAMLDGWKAQQISRNLALSTVESRRAVAERFRGHAETYPWEWTVQQVDEFFMELRAVRRASRSTVLGYQNALRMFLAYLTDPAYEWGDVCWERFGSHPSQVFHEWNTARHVQDAIGEPGKRPYTRDELEDLFDCADERVVRIRRSGSKGWIPAFRIATVMKVAYGWGLRRNEVRMLDLVDLASNPQARMFRDAGILYVRHGKAMRGSPPKRRAVLTLPEFAWAVDCLEEWIQDVRPYIAAPGSTVLWPSERKFGGRPITADYLSKAFATVKNEAGLDSSLDFHSLRRSYVTHLVEIGYDAFFIQQQVGHAHASTTSIYTGLSPDYRARVVNEAMSRMATAVTREGE